MVLSTSGSEAASEEEGSANESVPLDSPRPSPAQLPAGQLHQAQQQTARSPPRTTIEVEAGSAMDDDGGTLRIKDLDTGREIQIKQARPWRANSVQPHPVLPPQRTQLALGCIISTRGTSMHSTG